MSYEIVNKINLLPVVVCECNRCRSMSATLRLSPLTMLEVLSATSHLGKLSAKSSLSVTSGSMMAAMFSPVFLSTNNEQKGVHLQNDARFILACSIF